MLFVFETLLDFGLFVLIWMVQLIVYPSFLYYEPQNLIRWHQNYTGRIAIMVIPFMLGQLGFSVHQVYESISVFNSIKLALVLFVWIFTFVYFAPTHQNISEGNASQKTLIQLVRWNWYRTAAWTLVLLFSIVNFLNRNA